MNRLVGRRENPTHEYTCDCGVDVLVEHTPFQMGKGAVLSSEVQHCPQGQKQRVQGKAVMMREKRDDDEWVVIKRYPPVAKKKSERS